MPEEAIGAAVEAKVYPLGAGAVGFPRIVGAAILGISIRRSTTDLPGRNSPSAIGAGLISQVGSYEAAS